MTEDKDSEVKVVLSPKAREVFSAPRGSVSYRALYGGRGSGKSYSAALVAAIWGYVEKLRVLCVREFQNSIAQSFYAELKAAIDPWSDVSGDHGCLNGDGA